MSMVGWLHVDWIGGLMVVVGGWVGVRSIGRCGGGWWRNVVSVGD